MTEEQANKDSKKLSKEELRGIVKLSDEELKGISGGGAARMMQVKESIMKK
ncbi:bacteriocin-type signal sequence domain protein [Synechococcus sp. BIOS-E4-1]|uniref:hypothetical protein n=1 Tax=Synechococcus sp. BIOS-E4-1 TaxID=1400864 RepID=UPI00164615D7|nr:hypothetical protein [Synechococcus sp. BIOS-E4-1]QNI53569.1 bacteriocin-type signal sequence domain protein [Synechococcus sp. BIOS-E4-1]